MISLDGFLYLLGNLGISGQMPIADKGGVCEIGWFAVIRQRFPAPWARRGAVREFAVTGRAIHRGNYNALAPWRHGNAAMRHWAMKTKGGAYLLGESKIKLWIFAR